MTKIAEFHIKGTPRTSGKKKSPSQKQWEALVVKQLKEQWNRPRLESGTKVELDIVFRKMLEPTDSSGHGPDVDNLIKPILDGISKVILPSSEKNPNEKGDFLVYKITARKEIVESGEGVLIIVNHRSSVKPSSRPLDGVC